MTRYVNPRTGLALYVLALAGALVAPSLAQPAREPPGEPPKPTPPPAPGRLNEAREIAALIGRGQLKLADAVNLAEQHAKGVALEVECRVEPGEPLKADVGVPPPPKEPVPNPPPKPEPSAERRLIYEIPCFAADKIQLVRIDGASKKVIDMQERKDAEGGSRKLP